MSIWDIFILYTTQPVFFLTAYLLHLLPAPSSLLLTALYKTAYVSLQNPHEIFSYNVGTAHNLDSQLVVVAVAKVLLSSVLGLLL